MKSYPVEVYRKFRAERRLLVRQIAECIRHNVIQVTPWAQETIARQRRQHSAAIRYERDHSAA